VRVALAVDERQPHDAQPQPGLAVQLREGVLGRRLARRVPAGGARLVVLVRRPPAPRSVDQAGAGEHEPLDPGRQAGARQLDGRVPVDGQHLLHGYPPEGRGQVHDGILARHGPLEGLLVAQVPLDHVEPGVPQFGGPLGVADHDPHAVGRGQPRHQPTAEAPVRAGDEYPHSDLPRYREPTNNLR
jgi:hypothetical protein